MSNDEWRNANVGGFRLHSSFSHSSFLRFLLNGISMLGAELDLNPYVARFQQELARVDGAEVRAMADWIFQAWENDRFVYIFGNGGSGANATHMSEDLGKSTLRPTDLNDESKKRLKVMSLTDNLGWILAVGNDCGYEEIFVQQLMNYGREGDVAVAISGSGNSPNVLRAVDWANRHGLKTFGLTGYDGGKLRKLAHAGLHVPLHDMGMVESIHLALFHWVLNDVFARINREGRYAR
jgi:D-sedoheptulose 7-phosphate isomerase